MTLRMLISGGDQLNPASINHLLEQITVYNTYGPAEGTALTTSYCCNNGYSLASGHYPIGKTLEGTEIMLLDNEPSSRGRRSGG